MAELDREYLIIPTPEELDKAFESMRGRIFRAAERGEKAEGFGDIGYANANRILREAPHLSAHLERLAQNIGAVARQDRMLPEAVFLAGSKDLLEILSVATTLFQLPEIDS